MSGVVEGRIIDKVFSNVAFQSAASTLVRTGNTYLGIHSILYPCALTLLMPAPLSCYMCPHTWLVRTRNTYLGIHYTSSLRPHTLCICALKAAYPLYMRAFQSAASTLVRTRNTYLIVCMCALKLLLHAPLSYCVCVLILGSHPQHLPRYALYSISMRP